MNFKERGITVGDLLIALVVLIITIFFINKVSQNKKQVLTSFNHYEILNSKYR